MPISKDEARLIISAIDGALGKVLERISGGNVAVPPVTGKPAPANGRPTNPDTRALERSADALAGYTLPAADFEELYQKIKRRLIDECRVDPILLQLLTSSAPELRIDIEPRVVELSESSLRGRVGLLVASGWFDAVRTQGETIRELKRTGTEPAGNRMSEALVSMVNDGVLTREDGGYLKAPGVKVTKNELVASR